MPPPAGRSSIVETQPLLRSASPAIVGRLAFGGTVGALLVSWCALDYWDRELSTHLNGTEKVVLDSTRFPHPLILTCIQLAFMSVVFLILWRALTTTPTIDALGFRASLSKGAHWPVLVVSHVFTIYWVQALMMPHESSSFGWFAASRALEIPFAAVVRAMVVEEHDGGHNPRTVGMMFVGAWILYYSYTQISQCLCIWSGFGMVLTGPALYIMSALVLTVPVVNSVYQEGAIVQFKANPFLLLAMQNLIALTFFVPALIMAHFLGLENVTEAMRTIAGSEGVLMLVLWLCIQTAAISAVSVALICMVDSFWAVSLKSMRVVFWWGRQLITFYLTSATLLSIARPHASFWSFVMLCGLIIMGFALFSDLKAVTRKPFSHRASVLGHADSHSHRATAERSAGASSSRV